MTRTHTESSEGRYKATWERELRLPWREAGRSNHLGDTADSDQYVIKNARSHQGGYGATWEAGTAGVPTRGGSTARFPRRTRTPRRNPSLVRAHLDPSNETEGRRHRKDIGGGGPGMR
jgi:hypothetical protein